MRNLKAEDLGQGRDRRLCIINFYSPVVAPRRGEGPERQLVAPKQESQSQVKSRLQFPSIMRSGM